MAHACDDFGTDALAIFFQITLLQKWCNQLKKANGISSSFHTLDYF